MQEECVARYRLRFQLQEVDLPPGETLIGRSLDCQVTIEDPLVSRQHARIVVRGDEATLEDLGSRNGVRLNGVVVRTSAPLKDGDRLRIGTQELVVAKLEPAAAAKHARATGVLRLCANCKLPYPRELVACPNCEATEQTDEDTLSGGLNTGRQQSWSIQLLVEALERALSLARIGDAERILQRASAQLEEMLASGTPIEARHFNGVAAGALRVSTESNDVAWARWAIRVHRIRGSVPADAAFDELAALFRASGDALLPDIEELVTELHR
ncbi:FHA domain-containing protein, partial [bacterium]